MKGHIDGIQKDLVIHNHFPTIDNDGTRFSLQVVDDLVKDLFQVGVFAAAGRIVCTSFKDPVDGVNHAGDDITGIINLGWKDGIQNHTPDAFWIIAH